MTGALSPLSILKRLWGLCCILWGGQSVGACDRALGCTGIRLLLMHPRCSIPCSTSFRWPNKLSEAARELAHPLAMSHQIDPHPDPLRLCVCSQDYAAIEVSEQSTSSEPPSLALLGLSLRVAVLLPRLLPAPSPPSAARLSRSWLSHTWTRATWRPTPAGPCATCWRWRWLAGRCPLWRCWRSRRPAAAPTGTAPSLPPSTCPTCQVSTRPLGHQGSPCCPLARSRGRIPRCRGIHPLAMASLSDRPSGRPLEHM